MYAALLASALVVGCLLAVQTSANLQLNKAVGTPYGASTLQLTVATVLLLGLAVGTGTIGAVTGIGDVPLWLLLGGLASPLYITSGILLFPRLGALAAVGLFVTGQMFASLSLDMFGLLAVPQRTLSVFIGLGAVAVLTGITLIIRGQRTTAAAPAPSAASTTTPAAARSVAAGGAAGSGSGGTGSSPAGGVTTAPTVAGPSGRSGLNLTRAAWIALGIVAGAVLPIQGAVNAQLRAELEAPLAVGMISFTVATIAIALALIMLLALRATAKPQTRPLTRMPWWGWLGGGCAAAYVTATFLLIPEIGAATTVALTVTGQQLASAAIDNYGLFRMPKRALTTARWSGLTLLVAGSALVQLG